MKEHTSIRLDATVKKAVTRIAKSEKRSFSSMAETLLEEAVSARKLKNQ